MNTERWEACGHVIRTRRAADGSGGWLVAEVPSNTGHASEQARRIAACWNACEGLSTENLEDNLSVRELARRYNAALTALRGAAQALNDLNSAYGCESVQQVVDDCKAVLDRAGAKA